MDEILLISKPLDPPWHDGSKVLARELCHHATRYRFQQIAGVKRAWRMLAAARLLSPRSVPLAHFFFAPNPRTNQVLAALLRLRPRRVVHTVCSRPSGEVTTWFADTHVALTEATAEQLRAAGAPDVRVIPPGIAPHADPIEKAVARRDMGLPDAPSVLFAGDLVDSGGADVLADALDALDGVHAVFACRPKGQGFAERRAALSARLGDRATWLGVVPNMERVYAAVDVQCLPATDLLAKVDLPLVLLEGLRAGVPAVISDIAPINELRSPGVTSTPPGDVEALSKALCDALAAGRTASLHERYDATKMALDYEALYDEILT